MGIEESLDIGKSSVSVSASNIFRIADLGCSVGPNTFTAMDNIIQSIKHKNQIQAQAQAQAKVSTLPEFQVFFNDHFTNDFNTLFDTLPSDLPYFPAVVPGSFHQRLFPKASLNFVYSSYAIHGLSKFSKDMDSFLEARAEEMAPGGLMAHVLPGRPDGTLPTKFSLGPFFYHLEASLVDMANEGLLSESKLDSFNLPMYSPSPEELHKIVTKHGCFSILKIKHSSQKSAKLFTMEECRAGFEKVIETCFGCEIVEQVFDRYTKKIAGKPLLTADDGLSINLSELLKFKVSNLTDAESFNSL
ncbi:hypothetical protein LguiA_009284 [Lonicera macranthoides]